jgi:hypothetical protein
MADTGIVPSDDDEITGASSKSDSGIGSIDLANDISTYGDDDPLSVFEPGDTRKSHFLYE